MMNRSNSIQDSQMQSTMITMKYKLVFLGDMSVGKTSIINRFIFDTFDGKDNPTVGIDFISKTLYYDDRAVKLQLWDTAGQERFRSLIPSYIRDCSAAIVIFDCTSTSSFSSMTKWVEDIRSERGNDVILVIVANKIDLATSRVISREEGEEKARELDTFYIEVSAKTGHNVNQLFEMVANHLPGNENNKIFTSNADNTSNANIKLDRVNQTDDDLINISDKKCSC